MSRRLVLTALAAGCLLPLTGCIDLTQTVTLNPDGTGRVAIDMKLSPLLGGGGPLNFGGQNAKEKTPEEMLQDFAKSVLTKKGVTAWKDVSVKWTNEGKMHFAGTAYFEDLNDLAGVGGGDGKGPGGPSLGEFVITKEKESVWKIAARKTSNPVAAPNPNPNPPMFDPAKAAPKEWDEFVLKMRIAYQTMKPFLVMIFTDLKVTTVLKLPGEVTEVQGFKKEGAGVVSHTMDGDKVMGFIKKFMTQDVASWKRVMKDLNNQPVNPQQVMEKLGLPPEMMEPGLTLGVKGKPQFEYAKEVQAARMAYPQLREQLKLDASVKLPGEE